MAIDAETITVHLCDTLPGHLVEQVHLEVAARSYILQTVTAKVAGK